jgi:hypothetical protein
MPAVRDTAHNPNAERPVRPQVRNVGFKNPRTRITSEAHTM